MATKSLVLEPVTKAKQLIGLKDSSYKDYVAARILFLNDQLHQAAILANTCIEKEIKSYLYTQEVTIKGVHDSSKLLNLFRHHDPKTADKLNSDFLKTLSKIYRSRYHENLGPGYNFVIAKKKHLAELDYTYSVLEKKVRFQIASLGDKFCKTQYELAISNNYGPVTHDNYLCLNQSKDDFVLNDELVFEFRIAKNSEVLEAMYRIPKNLEANKFIYEGLVPGLDESKEIKLSHHYTISEIIYVSRNGHLVPNGPQK